MAVDYKCCESGFFIHVLIIVLLVVFAGLMSGLTLGFMSMSFVDLEVLAKSGTPKDRQHATKILPVVRKQHLLLCTLIICNAAAMEALPIFLDGLLTAWGAILISVTLILLFGEIILQSVCSCHGLAIGAAVAPFVCVLVWICCPIAFPISKLLDIMLGHGHVALFRRAELKTLVDFHGNKCGERGRGRGRERMGDGAEKVVCMIGASGYIVLWLVKLLLQCRYSVKASVRDPNDPKKTEHLLMLDGGKERLHLFKADLLEEGSFDSQVDGCEGIFHTASPVYFNANNPQAELIEPAVKGTLNVLRSCAKVSSVKRVVITSSMVAVMYNGKPLTPDVVVDETWFSDPEFCENSKHWYMLAKTLAEKAAWEFSKENGIDMVAMHPGWVSGPLLQPTLNATLEPFVKLVKGVESVPFISPRWVDVRDVANAHILAFENPSASGRYCLVARVLQFSGFVKLMRELFLDINFPEKCKDDHHFASSSYKVSRVRAKSLGLNFTPVEVTLKDTIESLRASSFFNVRFIAHWQLMLSSYK